jgi:hypothetical protein
VGFAASAVIVCIYDGDMEGKLSDLVDSGAIDLIERWPPHDTYLLAKAAQVLEQPGNP